MDSLETGAQTQIDEPVLEAAPSTQRRHVLVVGGDDWAMRDAGLQLAAAGWVTHRCSESADAPFPCRAMNPGEGCPLDVSPVSLVVAVRSRPGPHIALSEMGVVCGVRAGLPVVAAGLAQEAIAPWAVPVSVPGDLVATCQEVVPAR